MPHGMCFSATEGESYATIKLRDRRRRYLRDSPGNLNRKRQRQLGARSNAGPLPADAAQPPKEATARKSEAAVVTATAVEKEPSAPAASQSTPTEAPGKPQPSVDPEASPVIAEPAPEEELDAKLEKKAGDAEITEVAPMKQSRFQKSMILRVPRASRMQSCIL